MRVAGPDDVTEPPAAVVGSEFARGKYSSHGLAFTHDGARQRFDGQGSTCTRSVGMTLVQTEVKVSETSAPGTTDGTEVRLRRDTLALPNDDLVKVRVHRVGPVVVGNLHMSTIPATSGDIGGVHVLNDEGDNACRRSDDGGMSMRGTSKVHRVAVLLERMRVARG